MALLKLAHLYFAFLLTWRTDELRSMQIAVSTTRARARRVGVAGEPGEEQGAHEQQGFGRLLIPPQKNKAANDRASTSCEVSLE